MAAVFSSRLIRHSRAVFVVTGFSGSGPGLPTGLRTQTNHIGVTWHCFIRSYRNLNDRVKTRKALSQSETR